MTPVPYTDTGAAIAFYLTLGIFALLEQRVRWRSWADSSGWRLDRGSLVVVIGSVGLGLLGGFLLAGRARWAAIAVARWPIFILGLVVMVLGICLRQWAIASLGRFFTVDVRVHPGQTVVDSGPYRWVRHPSYTAMMIVFIGLGLALGNWASVVVLAVVPTAGLVFRIHAEEQALSDGLGEPYRRFAESRARLIPHVW